MGKLEIKGTPEDFNKLTRQEFVNLWFGQTMTDNPHTCRQIAKMYQTDVATVKKKKKELNVTWLNCAILFVAGGSKYRKKR